MLAPSSDSYMSAVRGVDGSPSTVDRRNDNNLRIVLTTVYVAPPQTDGGRRQELSYLSGLPEIYSINEHKTIHSANKSRSTTAKHSQRKGGNGGQERNGKYDYNNIVDTSTLVPACTMSYVLYVIIIYLAVF